MTQQIIASLIMSRHWLQFFDVFRPTVALRKFLVTCSRDWSLSISCFTSSHFQMSQVLATWLLSVSENWRSSIRNASCPSCARSFRANRLSCAAQWWRRSSSRSSTIPSPSIRCWEAASVISSLCSKWVGWTWDCALRDRGGYQCWDIFEIL